MRRDLTRERLQELMQELARSCPARKTFRVYFVGGGTAVSCGWRASTIDADLYSDQEEVFRDIQGIKERLQMNIEFVRPEDFVPPLQGSNQRHIRVKTVGNISFFHYDPYAQLLSKIVRGFRQDLEDAKKFLSSGMVDADRFRSLVDRIPESAYAKYPTLSRKAVMGAVDDLLQELGN
jgi:hypothetical protein